jgi:hypothetical protein
MSEDLTRLVVWTTLTIALGVWMAAVRFVARVRRASRTATRARTEALLSNLPHLP